MSKDYVKGLNGLRALCALFIVWGHVSRRDFCQWEVASLPLPECCAYVFFVISGFLAGFRIDRIRGFLTYYKKKARRILPLYYIYLFIAVLFYVTIGQSDQVLDPRLWYYVFLVPQIPFSRYSGLLPLVHLWFIGTIVLFYAIFPFFAKLKEQKRVTGAAIIAVFWLLVKLALRILAGTGSFLYHFVAVTSFDVLFAGVWAGLLLRKGNRFLCKVKGLTWLSIGAWLLFLFSWFYAKLIPAPVRIEYIAILALTIIITQQAKYSFPDLENRFLNWLGSISYEIYVTHVIVIIMLSRVYSELNLRFPDVVIYIICTVVVIGVAWCFNKVLGLRDLRRKQR